MKLQSKRPLFALLLLGASTLSCAAPALFESYDWPIKGPAPKSERQWNYTQEPPVEPSAGAEPTAAAQPPAEGALLGWESGVVGSSEPGAVVESSSPSRTIGPAQEGRMHIIELYSQVLDERDALAEEVEQLKTALMKTRTLLERGDTNLAETQSGVLELEQEVERLRLENQELSARLTTAQIRRLEAEKLLLEAKISEHRARQTDAAEALVEETP